MYLKKMRNLLFSLFGIFLMSSCTTQGENNKVTTVTRTQQRPTYLYKVLSTSDWEKSCKSVHLSSMDDEFIHFSTQEQLPRIVEKFWGNVSEYIVLKIETVQLPGNLVLEANPGGANKYYHLYNGSIPFSAIVEMKLHKR